MLIFDLHTHTVNSGDGLSTLAEMAKEASKRKLKILGITPHGPAVSHSFPQDAYSVFDRVPRTIFGVKVLMSVELNIVDPDGSLDIKNQNFKYLDYGLAGIHRDLGMIDNTKGVINAIKNKEIDIISHPYAHYMCDIEKVADAAVKKNKFLELNNSTFKYNMERCPWQVDQARKMIDVLKECNHKLIINSDAHIASDVGEDAAIWRYSKKIGLDKKMVLEDGELEFLKNE
jgi:putative hydrolase